MICVCEISVKFMGRYELGLLDKIGPKFMSRNVPMLIIKFYVFIEISK